MIHAHATENVDDNDASYPLPPGVDVNVEEPVLTGEGEPHIVPPPPTSTLTLPVPRARRELKSEIGAVKVGMAVLTKLAAGERPTPNPVAVDALVCAATDRRYPLDDTDPIEQLREQARHGRFTAHLPLAMDELEDVLATLEAGLAALKAISLLDEPIPEAWGNLRAVPLARKLNVLGHTLLRGRIAGVKL
jgi:hypothetical protein